MINSKIMFNIMINNKNKLIKNIKIQLTQKLNRTDIMIITIT